jgi:ADP-heptose:LPS heptosyltransferase
VNLPVRPDVIRARLRATGLGERPQFIALAPGSKMPAKRWPLENFAELGRRLLCGHPELRIVVVGGIADRGLGDTLCASIGAGVHNFAGALTLFESAALLAEGLCYVGNDTGTMHLAALAGTPCVALFSARDYPGKWDPAGSRHVVLRRDVPCAGCMLEICVDHGNRCLRLITVEDACVAVENVLSSTIAATSVAA